jgi:tetratricopeptide (TPR) repeat protein
MTLLVPFAIGAPYIPTDGKQVIEQLPYKALDPKTQELQALRLALQREPNNLELALRMARRYIEEARAESDPRYLGYAQAALAPWWTLASPPVEVLLLRATIKQSTHQFDAAMLDLSEVLKQNPNDAQAWLTRATILQVRGDYREATRSCQALIPMTNGLVSGMCFAEVGSVSGEAEKSHAALERFMTRAALISADEKVWILTLMAEIAERLGRANEADKKFQEALALPVRDAYLLAAYADFLLDQNRPQEVIKLLQKKMSADGLLLRLALAEKMLDGKIPTEHVEALKARFIASNMRGDFHRREEARFVLAFSDQPQAAVKLALDNWQVQREPWDVRVLLLAGIRMKDQRAISVARDWLKQSHLEDVRLQNLLRVADSQK